ncbi:MAG: phosphatase PAP2 family protein [Mycobacterium sp.]
MIRGPAALTSLATGLFATLALFAVGINARWLTSLDVSVAEWFVADRSERWLPDTYAIFDFVGDPTNVAIAAIVSGVLLSLLARSVLPAALVVGGVGVGFVVEQTLKAVVGRTSTAVAELQDKPLLAFEHTFPSGHLTGTTSLLGMIAVCLGASCGRTARATLAGVVTVGVTFVAFITLYDEFHTFSDVIGGVILGSAIVTLGAALLSASRLGDRAVDGGAHRSEVRS